MTEPQLCNNNNGFNQHKMKEKRNRVKDANNNKVKEHDWKTLAKKETKGKRVPEFVIIRNKNKYEVLQDDDNEKEEMEDAIKSTDAERKWNRIEISLIAYSCVAKEFNDRTCNNNKSSGIINTK